MLVPSNILNHRREQCERCSTPCEFQKSVEFRNEGDNFCPIGKWMSFKTFVKVKWKGMGDAVAALAEPIAAASDKILKTKIKGCGACAKRRAILNNLVPFKK